MRVGCHPLRVDVFILTGSDEHVNRFVQSLQIPESVGVDVVTRHIVIVACRVQRATHHVGDVVDVVNANDVGDVVDDHVALCCQRHVITNPHARRVVKTVNVQRANTDRVVVVIACDVPNWRYAMCCHAHIFGYIVSHVNRLNVAPMLRLDEPCKARPYKGRKADRRNPVRPNRSSV